MPAPRYPFLDGRAARGPLTLAALPAILALALGVAATSVQAQSVADEYRDVAERLIQAATDNHFAYERLTELVDRFGPRVSGSAALERAIDWMLVEMEADGLDNPRGDPVLVPHWVRGQESLEMILPWPREMPMLGLGGSVATPDGGIRAEVLVVESFAELAERADEAHGRIVLFDVPFTTYGQTVQYRSRGAIEAAKVGAAASIIRSVTPYSQQTPHTGNSSYEEGVPRIPHAAITVEDAMMLHRMQDRGQRPELLLKMEAKTQPDALSRNVMAEIVGTEFPDEVVVLGGHIDSWDVGQGAMDDAGGVVAAWEAVRLMKELGLQPRRTVRVVGWTSEENGGPGGPDYAETHADEYHVLAMESDGGVFKPSGFGFTGSDAAFEIVREIGTLLEGIEAGTVTRGGGGADIAPLMATGVPGMGLSVDGTRYFWYHHTDADTIDKLDPDEVALCVATMAVMAYIVADLPETLPR
ncbi:MAG: M20/M25/M40 family metallo-hydrolase [Gemmatimonadetes bacterium]|nr:M20/M25/M40 family metallo-hydrolase [Gemmatimonadota bacterium]NNF14083.1 M20/M25/M40 family metallo-hydrolase [Gemmatimonadota bacterium]